MRTGFKKAALKTAKWFGITLASLLLLLFLLPIIFPGTVAEQIKTFANKKIDGELNFSKSRLSFFNHFPSLTVTLYDFSLKGSAPYKNDTLVAAEEVAFGINLKRLIFDNEVRIDKIFLSESFVNVKINEKGQANYNVYISDSKKAPDTISNTSVKLEKIDISNCHLRYEDKSLKMLVNANGFNYLGKGDLSKSIFDLKSEAEIDSIDFVYDNKSYLLRKKITADLITSINTNSLAFQFQKNDLVVNKLPIKFKGKLNILKSGYAIDFEANSLNSNLRDLFTALPPEYVTWLDKTDVKGKIDLKLAFKGNYNAAANQNPTLSFGMKIDEGYIQYNKAPFPASDIRMNFLAVLPSMDTDRLRVRLDSLHFNLGKDALHAYVDISGLSKPRIKASVKAGMDLEKLDQALGLSTIDLKGRLDADVVSNGVYDPDKKTFPVTKGKVLLRNGYLKTSYYPNPITDINLDLNALNTTGSYQSTTVSIKPAAFTFEGKPFSVDASFTDFNDVAYDIKAKGTIDVGRIYKVFSQQGIDVTGFIKADLHLKGKQSYATNGQYAKLDNSGTLLIRNIKATSDQFPKPFRISEGAFTFTREKMNFDKFLANYGQSDFNVNGHLINAINYFFAKNATLHGNFSVKSNLVNVNEFMALAPAEKAQTDPSVKSAEAKNPTQSGVVLLPENLDVSLTANAKQVVYDKLNIQDLNGTVGISKGKFTMRNAGFELIGCRVAIDATYDDVSPVKAGFDVRLRARDFDVKRAYNEIQLFHDLVTAADKAEGIISLDYRLNGTLDGNMAPIYPSLLGEGTLSLRKVKIKGLRMFTVISKKTGSDGVDNPDLTRVDIRTSIKDNVIYVHRTRMGVALFRLRFEGKTNFDGQLNLKMRLGLPPFGVIGIPFTITGTQDNPKIKIFSKKTEETESTDYKGGMIVPNKALKSDLENDSGGKK
ncbi:AsmA-like C-terminal region-containing protein [Flavobacterium sp.]|uniref:AsmA family protein n=1 Tax=Flavobacterium sp. TaxID=239 RepID=UPI002627BF02|nr:AsmA-like C-terminal region-containing protein [Flavobacterium sp.]